MRSLVACVLIAGVGVGCGDSLPGAPDAPSIDAPLEDAPDDAIPAWPVTLTPGRSAARLAVSPMQVVVLEEALVGFDHYGPGPGRVRAIDRRSFAEKVWEAPAPARIADAVVHASGAVSVALVGDDQRITVVRLDADLVETAATLLSDPDVATDPPIDSVPPTEVTANGFTAASVRIGAIGDDAVVAVFTSRNALIAYRLGVADGAFAKRWRALVEPSVGLQPFLPIGGSFDTFGAIAAWFRPSFAVDAAGNAYLAIWAAEVRIRQHNLVFSEALTPLFTGFGENDSDVLLTKLDPEGRRAWTRVVGARHEDEPYGLAAAADEVVVVGRSRRNPGHDNSQWDPWIAALDGAGTLRSSRTLLVDNHGILLAAAVDDTGRIAAAGSAGFVQNPDGLSIITDGAKLLFTLAGAAADPARIELAPGPRHNELRSVVLTGEGTWFAGHEDGPLTHSGDGDASQIHATGVVGFVAR